MGKTVTTYLVDGDPKGPQYAFISNKICQMYVIPRSNLSYLNEQEKLLLSSLLLSSDVIFSRSQYPKKNIFFMSKDGDAMPKGFIAHPALLY